MKKYIVRLCLAILVILPISVFAEDDFTTDYGVVIPYDTYQNLQKMYSNVYISQLTQDDYDNLMSKGIDFDNISYNVAYIKTERNIITGETTESYVTKAEYDGYNLSKVQQRGTYETSYKRLYVVLSKIASNVAFGTVDLLWKTMPALRSYDIIAMRTINLTKVNGTQQGKQIYTTNGSNNYVQYNFNGTNINNFSNGFGISMNLVDNPITYLECIINADFIIEGYAAWIYGAYAHATTNISLTTSKSYTLSGSGMGGVILMNNNSHSSYFDGMLGTYSYISE